MVHELLHARAKLDWTSASGLTALKAALKASDGGAAATECQQQHCGRQTSRRRLDLPHGSDKERPRECGRVLLNAGASVKSAATSGKTALMAVKQMLLDVSADSDAEEGGYVPRVLGSNRTQCRATLRP